MAKTKSVFFCQNCGYESPKWQGKCPSCSEWNTFVEETISKSSGRHLQATTENQGIPIPITEAEEEVQARLTTGQSETDRVLGGGMVKGSLVLIAGEPGIGKSTLLLQMALNFEKGAVLYVSGEESNAQIADRAKRIGHLTPNCYLLSETNPESIISQAKKLNPAFIVIDSVQTLSASWIESSPGSISQIRESTARLMQFAKQSSTTLFLIGHITKEGSIAGPKVLEHMVDTVMVFEGDRNHVFRLLRSTKNRFGSTNEIGVYRMEGSGLQAVTNPSEVLINHYSENMSGSAASVIIEGIRPFIVEVQALVSSAVYGTPQRTATGFDIKRLNMLLAVLEKRCGFKLGGKDVFLNVAGGIKVSDPALDLSVAAAILSSSEDLSIEPGACFCGEIGLSGEIRPVNRVEKRISEAEKLGFKTIFVSFFHEKDSISQKSGIRIIPIRHIREMLTKMFG